MDLYALSSYQFELPRELIAQVPAAQRDASRLMIVDRAKETFEEVVFRELIDFLEPGDGLVFNDTKVIPARLCGRRESGGKAEIFLLEEVSLGVWRVMARPLRKLKHGERIFFSEGFFCTLTDRLDDGLALVSFNDPMTFAQNLMTYGQMPLPPYISREPNKEEDRERYQTVFAAASGAVAAPTAGLHFTEELLGALERKKIEQNYVTLHVGHGTFKPVMSEDITGHRMHAERFIITEETAKRLNERPKDKKQICVGTTCCRVLESVADAEGIVKAATGQTNIFIYPGYRFKHVRQLLTNFHLPGSSLLMLVSAFAGYELVMEAYKKAVKDRYRFFSYGDAMLIL